MVIRELLDCFDKEKAAHQAAIKRLDAARTRVLSCCREAKGTPTLKIAREEEPACQGRTRKAA